MRKSFRQTVWLRLPAATIHTCTDTQRTFFVPTFGICIWNWICLHCTRTLRRRSAAARLLRLWVRIPPGAWMFVCCECCLLSGRDVCDELITCPEESYRLWCVVVCDIETSRMRRPWPTGGCWTKNNNLVGEISSPHFADGQLSK